VTRRVQSSEFASEELTEAIRWYEERRPGLGAELLDAIVATVAVIESQPEIGAIVPRVAGTRRVLVPRFPYQIVYRFTATEIVIVAVAHLKRRPGYWKKRA
jgi:plasmid stabilization system protein ParE